MPGVGINKPAVAVRLKDVPALANDASNIKQVTDALREAVQTFRGYRGNELDQALTKRDLLAGGAVEQAGFGSGTGAPAPSPAPAPAPAPAPYVPDLTPPPTPSGLVVTAGLSFLYIEHDSPVYTEGHGHDRTVVFGRKWPVGDPLPTFTDAVRLFDFQGTIGAYPTEPATRWRIWIKWLSIDGVMSTSPAGGANGTLATTGLDPQFLVDALAGQITESELNGFLGARIDLVDGSGAGSVNQRLATAISTVNNTAPFESFTTWDFDGTLSGWTFSGGTTSSLPQWVHFGSSGGDPIMVSPGLSIVGARYDKIRARVRRTAGTGWDGSGFYAIDGGHSFSAGFMKQIPDATIMNQWVVLEWDMVALTTGGADWINNVIAQIRLDFGTTSADQFDIDWVAIGRRAAGVSTAVVQQEISTRATETGALFGQFTVKVDINGYVSGFGLASTSTGAAPFSSFVVRADSFAVGSPTGPGIAQIVPFMVRTTAGSVNGVAYPPGVYIDAAYILDLTAAIARLGNAWIDDAKIANLSAAKLTAGSGVIGGDLKSSNYVNNVSGWIVRPNGYAEFDFGMIRSQLVAGQIAANYITTLMLAAGSVTAGKISVVSLDAITATIGLLRTATSGARMEVASNYLKVFDASNVKRVQLGDLSA